MPRPRLQRLAPTLAVVLVALLAGLSLGTGLLIIQHFKADATATSRLYSGVFGGLNDPRPGGEAEALLRLGEQVRSLGLPLIVTDRSGKVTAAANLPFEAPLDDPRLLAYAARLDRMNPPIVDQAIGTVHYGPLPAQRNLTALAVLQALTIAVMVAVAVFAYRSAMAAQRDRLMGCDGARGGPSDGDAAHQPAGMDRAGPLPARLRRRISPITSRPTPSAWSALRGASSGSVTPQSGSPSASAPSPTG